MHKQTYLIILKKYCLLLLLASCSVVEGDSNRRVPEFNQKFINSNEVDDGDISIQQNAANLSKKQNSAINIFDNFFASTNNNAYTIKRTPVKNKSSKKIDQVFETGEETKAAQSTQLGIKNEKKIEQALESSKPSKDPVIVQPTKKPEINALMQKQNQVKPQLNPAPIAPNNSAQIMTNAPAQVVAPLPPTKQQKEVEPEVMSLSPVTAPSVRNTQIPVVAPLPTPQLQNDPRPMSFSPVNTAPASDAPVDLPPPVDIKIPLSPTLKKASIDESGCDHTATNLDVKGSNQNICALNFAIPQIIAAQPEDTITGYIMNLQEENKLASRNDSLPGHVQEKELAPLQAPVKKMHLLSSTQAFAEESGRETGAHWKEKIFEVKDKMSQYFNLIVGKTESIVH